MILDRSRREVKVGQLVAFTLEGLQDGIIHKIETIHVARNIHEPPGCELQILLKIPLPTSNAILGNVMITDAKVPEEKKVLVKQ